MAKAEIRVTLRLAPDLHARIKAAADSADLHVNTWFVQAAEAHLKREGKR